MLVFYDYATEWCLQNIFNEPEYFDRMSYRSHIRSNIIVSSNCNNISAYMKSEIRPVKVFWFFKDVLESLFCFVVIKQ